MKITKNTHDDLDLDFMKPKREIWVNSFTEKSALKFREQVLQHIEVFGTEKPIAIYIDSYGGYADSLASMIDTMDSVPNQFITVACGKAMSCGAILFSHGNYRFCGRQARLMVHEISAGAFGNARTVKNDANEIARINHKFMDLLAKNCGMSGYEELKKRFREKDADELWLSPDDALKFGLVDHIGMPLLTPVELWQVVVAPDKPREKIPEKKQKGEEPEAASKPKKAKKK